MLKACAAVEVQLDAYTCGITTSPSYLKLRKVDLNRPNGFLPEIYDISRIKEAAFVCKFFAYHS